MKKINLLPKAEVKALQIEQISSQVIRFWICVILSMLLLMGAGLGTYFLINQRLAYTNTQIEDKRATLNSSGTKALEQEVKALNEQIMLIRTLREDHYHWSKALTELVYLLKADTVITSVQLERSTGQVVVQGNAGTRQSIIDFWSNVIKSNIFENVDFPLTNMEKDVDADFTFTFYVKPEEVKIK